MKYSNLLRWWVFVKCEPKSSQLKEPDLNYFSLYALNLFNTRVSQFELNYWNKLTFPQHSNILRCTCSYSSSVMIIRFFVTGYYSHLFLFFHLFYFMFCFVSVQFSSIQFIWFDFDSMFLTRIINWTEHILFSIKISWLVILISVHFLILLVYSYIYSLNIR